MKCILFYLMGSVMERTTVVEWVPAGTTVQRTAKHSAKKIASVTATLYFNGKTFRKDYSPNGVSSVTVVAVPDNQVGTYSNHMAVTIR